MPQILYFLSDADGRLELSDGNSKLGHVEQAGLGFVVAHLNGSSFASKQEALAAIEAHTGVTCRPATAPTAHFSEPQAISGIGTGGA